MNAESKNHTERPYLYNWVAAPSNISMSAYLPIGLYPYPSYAGSASSKPYGQEAGYDQR